MSSKNQLPLFPDWRPEPPSTEIDWNCLASPIEAAYVVSEDMPKAKQRPIRKVDPSQSGAICWENSGIFSGGECVTFRTREAPRDAKTVLLSEILEQEPVPERYYLSQRQIEKLKSKLEKADTLGYCNLETNELYRDLCAAKPGPQSGGDA